MSKNTNEKEKVSIRQYLIACASGKSPKRKKMTLLLFNRRIGQLGHIRILSYLLLLILIYFYFYFYLPLLLHSFGNWFVEAFEKTLAGCSFPLYGDELSNLTCLTLHLHFCGIQPLTGIKALLIGRHLWMLSRAWSARAGCSGLCPVRFWVTSRMVTPQPSWTACSSIWSPSQIKRKYFFDGAPDWI